jgi:hypothetical protein
MRGVCVGNERRRHKSAQGDEGRSRTLPLSVETVGNWREISKYVGRGIRTLQRWETMYGFPIHRPSPTAKKGAVFSTKAEIDNWLRTLPVTETGNDPHLRLSRPPTREVKRTAEEAQLVKNSINLILERLRIAQGQTAGTTREAQVVKNSIKLIRERLRIDKRQTAHAKS